MKSRFLIILSSELSYGLRRPFFWIWFVILASNAWLMSTNNWLVRSVDTAVGTQKSFVNSEFQIAFALSLMSLLLFSFFMAISSGTSLQRDEQNRVGELIHSTPLKPEEYVWGKFFAVLLSSYAALALFLLSLMLFNEVIPNPELADIHGPFRFRNYAMPALCFAVPMITFVAGVTFAVAEFTKRALYAYLFPVIMILFAMNFLYVWFPPEPSSVITLFFQAIDPAGFRWLKQTWLMVDRGVAFYNTESIPYDPGFLASRFALILVGLGSVYLSVLHFSQKRVRSAAKKFRKQTLSAGNLAAAPSAFSTMSAMTQRPTGILKQIWEVTRFEFRELKAQPWIYLFIVVIAILLVLPDRTSIGPLRVQFLYTSGLVAVTRLPALTILVCLFLLFAHTDALSREKYTGLNSFFYSTPVRTVSLLIGKSLASLFIAILTLFASFLTVSALILIKKEATLELMPFVDVWVFLLIPTIVFWIAIVTFAYCATGSRMATYAIGLAIFFLTGWLIFSDRSTWITNWSLANSIVWSDFGVFELDREGIILNRLFYFSLALSLTILAVRLFSRRTPDRLQKDSFNRWFGQKLIFGVCSILVPPLVLGSMLWIATQNGFQGSSARKAEKDYWRHNIATFRNYPIPDRTFIDMNIRFEPTQRAFHIQGSYRMINRQEVALPRIPFTGIGKWSNLKWTVDGKTAEPENRSGLFVFYPDPPLEPQKTITIGFSYDGIMLPGISENGGLLELGEFILPSGILLTGRNPWFVPVPGFMENIGIDDDNRYQPEDPDPHFYEGITESAIDRSLLMTRIRLDVPEDFIATSMGVLTEEQVQNGRRTVTWESDYPLRVFNVAAGKYQVRHGKLSTIYFYPEHTSNVDSMLDALDGARQYYSEWFGPYPWKELRMNEFPGLSFYARGNPTNILFSEGMGFLTKDASREPGNFGMSAFYVTAHEAGHQWWGHLLAPGKGPGGIILAEGMANFASMCLIQKMRGEEERKNFNKQIERSYGEERFVTSERPLAETTGDRPADTTVIYDKGGWVFWMMKEFMGQDAMFQGLRDFIVTWHAGPDYPVIQDFVKHMRAYATDPEAYDSFVEQWFFQVAIPEYRFLSHPEKQKKEGGWEVHAHLRNVGNASMQVDIAAVRESLPGARANGSKESRVTVTLAAGQEKEILIHCDFEPDRIVVDPDVRVLQLQRNGASYRFR